MKTFIIRHPTGSNTEVQGTRLTYNAGGQFILIENDHATVAVINNGPGIVVYEKQK